MAYGTFRDKVLYSHVHSTFNKFLWYTIPACEKPNLLCQGKGIDYKICVPKSFICDGEVHCQDGLDEAQDDPKCEKPIICNNDEFGCNDRKQCIPYQKLCDLADDCTDKSDEDVGHCGRKITIKAVEQFILSSNFLVNITVWWK